MHKAFTILISLIVLFGCEMDTRNYSVRIVIPDDFRGTLRLVFHDGGKPAVWDGSSLVFHVPESGVLVTEAENPFLKSGSGLKVETRSGRAIAAAFGEEHVGDDEILFRSVGGTNDGSEYWAVIGTQEDADRATGELHQLISDRLAERATDFGSISAEE